MREDLDIQIQHKEAEFLPICQLMEKLKDDLIRQTIAFATEWYGETAKAYVAKYSEATLRLKEEKIVQMKLEVNQLIRNTERNVRAELEDPKVWWHQTPHTPESVELYLQVGDKYPDILDRAVRHVLGKLGVILEEYHYNVNASGITSLYEEFWFDRQAEGGAAKPYFPHLLAWSEEMQKTAAKYSAQYLKALALYGEIVELKAEKKRIQALNRWDSI